MGYFNMNRFTIDENAGHEIVNIYGVEEYRWFCEVMSHISNYKW